MDRDPDLFDAAAQPHYPDAPGHRRVETSIEAANDIAPSLARLQHIVLEAVDASGVLGLTAHECAAATAICRETTQPRLSELQKLGKVVNSGQRRPNASGKSAICWVTLRHFQSAAA